MKAAITAETNTRLTLTGDKTGDRDLPCEKIRTYDPELGQSEKDAVDAFESTWVPTREELERLLSAAPVILRVWGSQHPPVSLSVADVGEQARVEVLDRAHVNRALGHLHGWLEQALDLGPIEPSDLLSAFERGLVETEEGAHGEGLSDEADGDA